MLSPLSITRWARASIDRNAETAKVRIWNRRHSPPRSFVYKARGFGEYRAAARIVARMNSRWLRTTWFRDGEPTRSELDGYCFACHKSSSFAVDSSVCSTWNGRPVPWWTNTLYCRGCYLAARMRATVQLLEQRVCPSPDAEIYLTEQVTPLYGQFVKRYPRLVGSEYLVDSTSRGELRADGVRCEDLTELTFPDGRFDYLLSFEVLEHIPDYERALRECARVLKKGGRLICTAPFTGEKRNRIRARVSADGSIEHILPPEYHPDPVNPAGVLCFREFGVEVLDDLRKSGFTDAYLCLYWSAELGYLGENRVFFVGIR